MAIASSTIKLLRIPFSFFLSPLYFFALGQVKEIDWKNASLIFIILHFLIYPASNGYNSYMDRDTQSIGGLEKPPPPSKELYLLTIVMDSIAIALCFLISPLFALVALFYIGASKAYSYRGIRLKKYPVTGYLVVILFQGALTYWLVYSGSSTMKVELFPWKGMMVSALLIGGFYPLTQIYQHQQDLEDGVETISYKLGYRGTFVFCAIVYSLALACISVFFIQTAQENKLALIGIFFAPVIVYFLWWFSAVKRNSANANFRNTMKMNWLAAICTNTLFIILLIWR
jgi:1,4-dihydroxy-2-naphthoate polyprenyltransferase